MKVERIICDKCKKECLGDYFVIFRMNPKGNTIGRGDICNECYDKMAKGLKEVTKNDKRRSD